MICKQRGRGRWVRGLVVYILTAQLLLPVLAAAQPEDSTQQGSVDLRAVERPTEKAPGNAPDLTRLSEGDRVRLLLATRGEQIDGHLVRVDGSRLILQSGKAEQEFAVADVRQAWVGRTRTRDTTIMLGLAGAVVGGIYGLNKTSRVFDPVRTLPAGNGIYFADGRDEPYRTRDVLAVTAAGAVVGAFTGLMLGSLSTWWEPVGGSAAASAEPGDGGP